MATGAIANAFFACLFTYALTAFGALGVFVFDTYGNTSKTAAVMATAVGLMLSAVMDLLQECLAVSEEALGIFAWVPIAVGVLVACVVLVGLDSACGGGDGAGGSSGGGTPVHRSPSQSSLVGSDHDAPAAVVAPHGDNHTGGVEDGVRLSPMRVITRPGAPTERETRKAWLLFFALTVQHIPEALAMGVAFADAQATGHYGTAISVTLAIGLQDIPEGLAAALVLRQLGMPKKRSFMFGQATGLVQPISGVLGALAVMAVKAALPYALAFAGACMLFVVVKDMLPDCMKGDDHTLPTLMVMVGFAVMMIATVLINSLQV